MALFDILHYLALFDWLSSLQCPTFLSCPLVLWRALPSSHGPISYCIAQRCNVPPIKENQSPAQSDDYYKENLSKEQILTLARNWCDLSQLFVCSPPQGSCSSPAQWFKEILTALNGSHFPNKLYLSPFSILSNYLEHLQQCSFHFTSFSSLLLENLQQTDNPIQKMYFIPSCYSRILSVEPCCCERYGTSHWSVYIIDQS